MAKAKKQPETILPPGPLYRIRYDFAAIGENIERRRAAAPAPRRLHPVIVVVDEEGTVYRARSVRTLGEVTFTEVNPNEYANGVHELRGSVALALTSDAIELIQPEQDKASKRGWMLLIR